MRLAVTTMILALMVAATPAHARDGESVVQVMVPAGSALPMGASAAEEAPGLGWARVVVPVVDTVDNTVSELAAELNTQVLVEQRYPLLGPEEEPSFPGQWGLENVGQQGGRVDADIDAIRAWSRSLGAGIVIAVIDAGVETDHPELDDQIWTNAAETVNGLDDDANGYVDDVVGWDFQAWDPDPRPEGTGIAADHATLVAGIAAAEANGSGIAGVAPAAKIMNLRACDKDGCFSLDAAAAIRYAADNGADIVNLSFGGPVPIAIGDPPMESAIDYARGRGVLVVTAAGNTPPGALPPGTIIVPAQLPNPNNVAVAATTRADSLASFSFYGSGVDMAAPGEDILSTSATGYATATGTSFAAPFVSGAAALLLATDPGISYQELSARLMAWVDRPSGVAGRVEAGRLNAGTLLTKRFIDTVGHTFESETLWAAETGVTAGCNPPENTWFCPDEAVTREQMAAFLVRYLHLPPVAGDYFGDDGSSTFQDEINRLAAVGITRGCNPPRNDRFCPRDVVTREQMAAFLVRALGLSEETHPGFLDVSASNAFRADIEKLATAGITRGCNPPHNTWYCPKDGVTRGQMVAFLRRVDG
ncbi:MAG: S8 family serine peptidase [Acidimicrobiia bacterium]